MTERDRYDKSLGGGIALSPDFGLIIDDTGDVATVQGEDELAKDTAYKTYIDLYGKIGKLNTPNTRENIRLDIREIVREDPRLKNRPQELILGEDENESSRIIIRLTVVAQIGKEINLVYPLEME